MSLCISLLDAHTLAEGTTDVKLATSSCQLTAITPGQPLYLLAILPLILCPTVIYFSMIYVMTVWLQLLRLKCSESLVYLSCFHHSLGIIWPTLRDHLSLSLSALYLSFPKPPAPVPKKTARQKSLVTREKSLDLPDRHRQEARRRLMAAKRAASFRQNSASERADSIEIYIPEAQTRLWEDRDTGAKQPPPPSLLSPTFKTTLTSLFLKLLLSLLFLLSIYCPLSVTIFSVHLQHLFSVGWTQPLLPFAKISIYHMSLTSVGWAFSWVAGDHDTQPQKKLSSWKGTCLFFQHFFLQSAI